MQRNTLPIANLYFKFLHHDAADAGNGYQAQQLTNKYQEIVVDEIVGQISHFK
jgi:hypothetical protein